MPWLIANWRLVALAALVLGIFGAGYRTGASAEKQDRDKERAQIVKDHLAELTANHEIITELGVKRAESDADLELLRAHPADRVRLPKANCPKPPNPTSGVAIPTPGPERTADPAQDALGEAQSAMESDAAEWSRALNACQVMQDYLKSWKEPEK